MGTPAGVATEIAGEPGWTGRYVNSDGYPDGLGTALFEAYHTAFDGDVQAMINKLILEPTHDWSALAGTDMSLEPAWYEFNGFGPYPPRNYAFRDGERPSPRLKTGDDFGTYLYLLGEDGMNVYVKYAEDRNVPAYTFIAWSTPLDEARQILVDLNAAINR